MKNIHIFLFLFLSAVSLGAQDTLTATTEKFLPKISLINPGMEAEFGLAGNTTLNLTLNLGSTFRFGFRDQGDVLQFATYTAAFPVLAGDFRFYYNLQKRQAQGKEWRGNSGDFAALQLAYAFRPLFENFGGDYRLEDASRPEYRIGATWGMQRTFSRHGNLFISWRVGTGVAINDRRNGRLYGAGGFSFGWAIR